jgi:hypothetical protein
VALEERRKEIQYRRVRIKDLQEDLRHFALTPLPKSTTAYLPVYPGEPQYEEADTAFDSKQFTGTWKFQTQQ